MYPTHDVIERLSKRLGLPAPDPFTQDWEYESSDPSKIEEWLDVYETGDLAPSELSLLMTLLLASYNDALSEGSARAEDWARIERNLTGNKDLHSQSIEYWSLPDEKDLENCFPVTPLIRSVRA